MPSKEAELLMDGTNAEKSCSCTKLNPGPTDLAKGLTPIVEAETTNAVAAPICGPESQPKTEADTIPSTSGSSKNQKFKLGIYIFLKDLSHYVSVH